MEFSLIRRGWRSLVSERSENFVMWFFVLIAVFSYYFCLEMHLNLDVFPKQCHNTRLLPLSVVTRTLSPERASEWARVRFRDQNHIFQREQSKFLRRRHHHRRTFLWQMTPKCQAASVTLPFHFIHRPTVSYVMWERPFTCSCLWHFWQLSTLRSA